jgi:hypothetical protein
MGIFADTCHALIDPSTGRALSGDALAQARDSVKHPRCGNKVKKSARFCNKCGSPAPGGWWQCHSCGKWVGNESAHCWNCGTALHPGRRVDLNGGVWAHQPGIVAQRFEVGDIKRLLSKGLQIQEGTVALLIEAGRYMDHLSPGMHNLDSLARKINHWGSAPPRSVVLVESSEIILPMRIEGLRSAEEMELQYYGELIIGFEVEKAQGFLSNLLKQKESVTFEDLSELLSGEVRHAIVDFCNTTSIDDIVKDPERRLHLEARLRETLERSTASWGIGVRRVSAAEFYGKAYEEIRAKAGEAEGLRRQHEFTQKIRDLNSSDQMHQFKTEEDLSDYVATLAHERGITDAKRDFELARLKQVHRHDLEGAELDKQMQDELMRSRHEIEVQTERDRFQRQKQIDDMKAEVETAREALALRREKDAAKHESMAQMAKVLEGKDINTLIGLVDDPDRRKALMDVYKLEALKGRATEEILALTAADSPDLAQALVQVLSSRKNDQIASIEKMRDLNKEQAAQLERILDKAFRTASDAAKTGGSTTHINR